MAGDTTPPVGARAGARARCARRLSPPRPARPALPARSRCLRRSHRKAAPSRPPRAEGPAALLARPAACCPALQPCWPAMHQRQPAPAPARARTLSGSFSSRPEMRTMPFSTTDSRVTVACASKCFSRSSRLTTTNLGRPEGMPAGRAGGRVGGWVGGCGGGCGVGRVPDGGGAAGDRRGRSGLRCCCCCCCCCCGGGGNGGSGCCCCCCCGGGGNGGSGCCCCCCCRLPAAAAAAAAAALLCSTDLCRGSGLPCGAAASAAGSSGAARARGDICQQRRQERPPTAGDTPQLGQPPVQRGLATLEAGPHAGARAGLLAAVTEAAGAALRGAGGGARRGRVGGAAAGLHCAIVRRQRAGRAPGAAAAARRRGEAAKGAPATDLAGCMAAALPLFLPARALGGAEVVQPQALLLRADDHVDGPEGPGGPQGHRPGQGGALEQAGRRRDLGGMGRAQRA